MNDRTLVQDNINIPTHALVGGLIGLALDNKLYGNKDELLVEWSAGRLLTQRRVIRFLGSGLIVTNALWTAHYFGWV